MNRIKRILSVLTLAILLFSPHMANAHCYYCHPAPCCCYKVPVGTPFPFFDIDDIYNQRWVSTYLRGRPVIILTAHRYQRYEVQKWAEAFRQEYMIPQKAYVLWVVNLRKVPWNTSRQIVYDQWRWFNPSVPLLLDWDGIIGRSLRINYSVPNIIVLDSYGRLVMQEMHT